MKEIETEIGYSVVYQKRGSSEWYVFTNHTYAHAIRSGMHSETTDLTEAMTAARELLTRDQYVSKNPKYQSYVVAAQVIQRIHMGGVLVTLGTPHHDTEED